MTMKNMKYNKGYWIYRDSALTNEGTEWMLKEEERNWHSQKWEGQNKHCF